MITFDQLNEMYWGCGMKLHDIAAELQINYKSLHSLMVKLGIPRRTPGQACNQKLLKLNEATLHNLYEVEFKSVHDIAREFSADPNTVLKYMRRFGIKSRKYTVKNKKIYQIDPQNVINLYKSGYSRLQIASKLGCSDGPIRRIMESEGLAARTDSDSLSARNESEFREFSAQQTQLILGTMLGDACLHHNTYKTNSGTGRIINTYRLIFVHSIKQSEYMIHIKSILGGNGKISTRLAQSIGGKLHLSQRYTFCHTPSLRPVAALCHNERHIKTVSKQWLDLIDWPAIAYWYMDDGHLSVYRNHPTVYFHTNSFSGSELTLLQDMLDKFGLSTRRQFVRIGGDGEEQWSLASRHKSEAIPFMEHIKPWVIPPMNYKIRYIL